MITLVIHPIDTERHTTIPPGWRWAVMVGGGEYHDMRQCANAGWCPTRQEALLEGEMVAVTVVKALRMMNVSPRFSQTELDYDPIPADADLLGTPA